jgi:hypothetical protein
MRQSWKTLLSATGLARLDNQTTLGIRHGINKSKHKREHGYSQCIQSLEKTELVIQTGQSGDRDDVQHWI